MVNLCFSIARGSRGTRQLKDFMADAGNRMNQQRTAADQLSDGHEAVASDNSDNEDAGHSLDISNSCSAPVTIDMKMRNPSSNVNNV